MCFDRGIGTWGLAEILVLEPKYKIHVKINWIISIKGRSLITLAFLGEEKVWVLETGEISVS